MGKAQQKELLKLLEKCPTIEAFFDDLYAMLETVCLQADVECPHGFDALDKARDEFKKFDDLE